MKIVVLDGYTANPGDLSWDGLAALGELEVFDRTSPAEVVGRARGAEVVLTNKVALGRDVIEQLPQLKYIGVLATGYNVVDVAAAKERGIVVTNVPAYSTDSVAQLVVGHALEFAMGVGHFARTAPAAWPKSKDFAYWDRPLIELAGQTMGIIGLGRIGRAVARIADAMGMRVIANNLRPPSTPPPAYVAMRELDEVFAESDVLTLHCPLTPQTQGLVNAERLGRMKRSAFLINTGRGPLVNEADLAEALNTGRIAGAGLDVLSVEPPSATNPLLSAKNCQITPHVGWATRAARSRLIEIAVGNVKAFLGGEPRNRVA